MIKSFAQLNLGNYKTMWRSEVLRGIHKCLQELDMASVRGFIKNMSFNHLSVLTSLGLSLVYVGRICYWSSIHSHLKWASIQT